MIKKMTLLAMAVAAIAAFTVPASASAATDWTENGVVVGSPVDLTETFEGRVEYTLGAGVSLGCQVTVKVTVTGPTSAEITDYKPTTSTCTGTGPLAACKVKKDTSNVPWNITNGVASLSVTKTGGIVTMFNEYEAGCPLGASSDREFKEILLTPTLVGGVITKFTISGTSTTGIPTSGSVEAEAGTTKLGLK